MLRLIGTMSEVARAAKELGYPDRPTTATDMVFVGIGIVLGGLVGLLSVTVGGIPLTLTASGGALVMGLVFGWLRSVYPFFGRIPEPAIWIFDTVGLCIFIGVVGLSAGPSFFAGLQETGPSLVVVGLVSALLPHTLGILFGRYVLKMNPLIVLGACAGAGTDYRRPSRRPGRVSEQRSRAGIHCALRPREHSPYGLGTGHRRDDDDHCGLYCRAENTAARKPRMSASYNAAVDMVDRNVAQGRGAKVAFIDPARRLTYGELAEQCARVAPMLAKLGLQREDRVAMMALDTVDFPVLFWGAIRAGIIPVPLNTLLTAEQYRYILEDARAKVLFVSAPLLGVAQQATAGLDLKIDRDRRAVGRLAALRPVARGGENRRAAGEDLAPTKSRSGSTPRARPACRRACATCMRARWRPRNSTRKA